MRQGVIEYQSGKDWDFPPASFEKARICHSPVAFCNQPCGRAVDCLKSEPRYRRASGFLPHCDFDIRIRVAPQEWHAREKIFSVDGAAYTCRISRRKDSRCAGELGTCDFSAYGAGCDLDLRIIPDPFYLAEFAAGHEEELVVFFGEPHRRIDRHSGFAEGRN